MTSCNDIVSHLRKSSFFFTYHTNAQSSRSSNMAVDQTDVFPTDLNRQVLPLRLFPMGHYFKKMYSRCIVVHFKLDQK